MVVGLWGQRWLGDTSPGCSAPCEAVHRGHAQHLRWLLLLDVTFQGL